MNKIIIGILVLIVVAVGAYVFLGAQGTVPESNNENTTVSGMRAEENAVVVMEQRPGTSVAASLVYLANPGFLVIHDDTDGEPGAILGVSSLLQAGESSQIVVPLSRATQDGERLHAMLHADVDANGSFDASTDTPVQSRLGGPLEGWFEVSSEASGSVPVSI
jgi:hypothetical protein